VDDGPVPLHRVGEEGDVMRMSLSALTPRSQGLRRVVGVACGLLALTTGVDITMGSDWHLLRQFELQGVRYICVTNGTQVICGPSKTPPPGQKWSLTPQTVCDASGNQCEPFQQAPPPSVIYLPPVPTPGQVYSDAIRRGVEQMTPPPEPPPIACTSRPFIDGWRTTCR
jgi:hypothetical protein